MDTILLHWDGEGWAPTLVHRKVNNHVGILVGGGPSLNKIDISKLNGPGKTVFGMNNTYPQIKPDIWMGMDDPNCYHTEVFFEPFMKILRGGYQERPAQKFHVKRLYNVHYANFDHPPDLHVEHLLKTTGKKAPFLYWYKNTFLAAIGLMLHMGYRKIYLAGCDLNNKTQHYFNDIKLTDPQQKRNADLYDQLYTHLTKLVELLPNTFYSISPGSRINLLMPYVDLDTLNSGLVLPKEQGELLYCTDAEEKLLAETKEK